MRHRRFLAAAALLAFTSLARAEHFEYDLQMRGTYTVGGTDGCTPPGFDQPACPQSGRLTAVMSFDLPAMTDGDYLVGFGPEGVSNFNLSLGSFSTDSLLGDIQLIGGVPSGNVQAVDGSERFMFDWGQQTAFFTYSYGDFGASGTFSGAMTSAPEPSTTATLLLGLCAGLGWARRSRRR